MKAYWQNRSGFSLIEVLVSLSILFFFILAFSVLFSNSFSYIFESGSKTEIQYSIQEAAENRFLGSSAVFTEVNKTEYNINGFSIIFNEFIAIPVLLNGRLVEMEASYTDHQGNEKDIMLTFFKPSGVTN